MSSSWLPCGHRSVEGRCPKACPVTERGPIAGNRRTRLASFAHQKERRYKQLVTPETLGDQKPQVTILAEVVN